MQLKKRNLLYATIIIGITANWSNEQNNTPWQQEHKQSVNFFGTLYTRNGEVYNIDNISIGRLFKGIKAYEVPKNNEIQLSENPTEGITTKLDLVEISSIRTIHPIVPRFYQKKSGTREREYIEIEVTQAQPSIQESGLTEKSSVKNRYLIEKQRKLLCDQISPSGPIEKEVPFDALDHVDIKGYKKRDVAQKNDIKKTA